MPHLIPRDVHVAVNGVDLSDHVREARWIERVQPQEITGVSDTHRRWRAGPLHGEVVIEWLADYHAGTVYRTLQPLIGKIVEITMQPHGTTVMASNPSHRANVLVTDLPMIDAAYAYGEADRNAYGQHERQGQR